MTTATDNYAVMTMSAAAEQVRYAVFLRSGMSTQKLENRTGLQGPELLAAAAEGHCTCTLDRWWILSRADELRPGYQVQSDLATRTPLDREWIDVCNIVATDSGVVVDATVPLTGAVQQRACDDRTQLVVSRPHPASVGGPW